VTVDLSAPPEHRWDHVITAPGVNQTLWASLAEITGVDGTLLTLAGKRPLHNLHEWMPADQAAELTAISKLTKIPMGTLFAITALYDLTTSATIHRAACTSIVVQDATGHVSHGRNLDYGLANAMLNITVTVDWLSATGDGSVAFTSVGYLGQVGFNTVVRHGAWGLTHDERDQGPITTDWWDVFIRRRVLTFAFIRETAQSASAPTFAAAVEIVAGKDLAAPSYFLLSGVQPGEGALVTHGRDGTSESAADIVRLDAANGRWYVLETNYDHDKPTDAHDDRRAVATRAFARLGQQKGASINGLLSVLTDSGHCNKTAGERPVHNSHTVYTAAFAAASPGANVTVILHDPLTVDGCVS